MNRDHIVYLNITTWAGVSLGAQHWYGELKSGGDESDVELTRILTPRQAAKANRYRSPDDYLCAKAGDESTGFDSKEEIRKLGLKVWRKHFPNGRILIEGRNSVCDPQLILAWSEHPELLTEANKLFEEFESFEGYQYKRNWPMAEEIQDKWDALIESEVVNDLKSN